jgi:hypothetical protein
MNENPDFIKKVNPDGSIEWTHKDADSLTYNGGGTAYILTPEQLAEVEENYAKMTAKEYLATTDWYVVRKAETGVEIPSEVETQRLEARKTLNPNDPRFI